MRVIMQWGDGTERVANASRIDPTTDTVFFVFEGQDKYEYAFRQVGDFWYEPARPHQVVHIQPYQESEHG